LWASPSSAIAVAGPFDEASPALASPWYLLNRHSPSRAGGRHAPPRVRVRHLDKAVHEAAPPSGPSREDTRRATGRATAAGTQASARGRSSASQDERKTKGSGVRRLKPRAITSPQHQFTPRHSPEGGAAPTPWTSPGISGRFDKRRGLCSQ
jgi:hypothetical protein